MAVDHLYACDLGREQADEQEISDADFEALQAKLFGKNKKQKDAAKGPSVCHSDVSRADE